MKITEVKAHALSTPIPERMRVESGAGLKLNRQMILVEVRTDEGVTGVGSPSGPYDLAVLKRAIEDVDRSAADRRRPGQHQLPVAQGLSRRGVAQPGAPLGRHRRHVGRGHRLVGTSRAAP